MRILVVDDDPETLIVHEAALRGLGHEVILATDGVDAWKTFRDDPVRIVVSDWVMPREDGLDLCRRIRAASEIEYTYFILATLKSGDSQRNRRAALEAGVDDMLTKPVDPVELEMRLHVADRILGLSKEVQSLSRLLPICCYCKKIRDDKNYWEQVEDYLGRHSGAQLSHGICPDCYQTRVMPQIDGANITLPQPPLDLSE